MSRYKLLIEFDGTAYAGWQRQKNGPSIQAAVEEAIAGFCGEVTTVHAAGRTDAGVHALAMAAHVDIQRLTPADKVRDALNYHLRPAPITILDAIEVAEDFHARFSCKARHYEYRIVNRRAPLTLRRYHAWWVPVPLNVAAMHEAAQGLVGQHDFTTFRASQCQALSPVKTLSAISVVQEGEVIRVRCSAPSFLHHQVRSIVGSLVEVGKGAWQVQGLRDALEATDRTACGQVAPALGLYFVQADYEEGDEVLSDTGANS